jgi:hypothetical protein
MSEVVQAIQTIRHCRRCPVGEKGSSLTELVLVWAGTGHYHQPPAVPTLPIKAMLHKAMIIFNVYDMYLRFHCNSRERAKSLAVFQVPRGPEGIGYLSRGFATVIGFFANMTSV